MSDSRVVVWFSCGAASAVAAQLALEKYGSRVRVVYCDTLNSEHPDNLRFLQDVSRWLDCDILRIKSTKYDSVDDVFERTRYMSGIAGARCTVEMKKVPRNEYQRVDDIQVFGFTVEERTRVERFREHNPELNVEWILGENFIRKRDCFRILERAKIKQPLMYSLGFEHNNCIGCVKATSASYWQKVHRHFPEVFQQRVEQSRELNVRLVQIDGERRFLDEIDLSLPITGTDGDIECGPYCAQPALF